MAYIPKNKIITNLYTNTKKLEYKDTKEPYVGRYWKSYDGKYFTGKNPNDTPSRELIEISITEEGEDILTQINKIAYTDAPTIFDDVNNPEYDESLIIEYSRVKGINLNKIPKQISPKHSYPTPTSYDYKLGVFNRHFLYKVNEPIFLEIDATTMKAFIQKDKNYHTTPYTPFQILWTIGGDKNEAFNANKKLIELTERRIKRRGLKKFLKFNYTKFWLPE